jgi:hypothetical protein
MRKFLTGAVAAAMCSTAIAASADYFLKIEGVARDAAAGPIYLKVSSIGDLDSDGFPDDGILRINCTGDELRAAHYNSAKSQRDAASGQASGKRTHSPVTFVKEWGASTPMLRTISPGWDIKKNEGGRMAVDAGGWTEVSLTRADGLCAAAAESLVRAKKSRSNIQNN